ncbi:MAG: NUDIX hydrolase [Clostridia bacterium]|nr:NUDIX hydrolase [Clostridia bacterium]
MLNLRNKIEAYVPFNAQEAADRRMMLRAIDALENPLSRENVFAHFTASAWIVNPGRTRALMAWHNIYKTWAWTGGHADGEADLLSVALREAREETGVREIRPVMNDIYSLEVVPVNAHVKRGSFVSAHLHMNVTYLLEADDSQPLQIKPDENSAVGWLSLDQAADNRDEPYMTVIYRKLNEKLNGR